MNRAMEELAKKAARGGRGQAAKPLRELGEHPTDGGPVNVMEGRYGPYVKWEKVNATLPKGTEPDDVTMDMAVELITAKASKKGTRKKAAPKKTATKTTAKKPAAKKPAAKKAPAKSTTKATTSKTAAKSTAAKSAAAKKPAAKKAAPETDAD